ncbi:serine hydrolase domain-containing protein [Crossiella sp. CA198]|uniref:serine hydrolase domain-containing protein n=1 Tax=Crossiella sp. CA198 TaxID=3455607 RepID=UPI003F8D73D8
MMFVRVVVTLCALLLLSTPSPAAAAPDPLREAVQRDATALVATGVIGAQYRVTRTGASFPVGAGTTRLGGNQPVPLDGRFRIGSITKTFVATTTLQLAGEGHLDLDDPVSRHLPGLLPYPEVITVRNLLQHTSGLWDHITPIGESPQLFLDRRFDHRSPLDAVRAVTQRPLEHPPGTRFAYTNTGYEVLALLIEKITGRPWTEETRRRILQPLRLSHTRMPSDHPFLDGPHAHGYLRVDGLLHDVTTHNPTVWGAGGGMTSTTADLDRFLTALLSGRLLAPAQQAELTRTTPVSEGWGLGIRGLTFPCGVQVWGHTGGLFGYLSLAFGTADGSRRVIGSVTTVDTEADGEAYLKVVQTALCG